MLLSTELNWLTKVEGGKILVTIYYKMFTPR